MTRRSRRARTSISSSSARACDAHGVTPTPLGLIEESERLHWHQEEPFLSASIYLQWCVMRLAHEHRTTVLLDGQGADELLAGYQFYFPAYQLDLVDRRRVRPARSTTRFLPPPPSAGEPRLRGQPPTLRHNSRSVPGPRRAVAQPGDACPRGRTTRASRRPARECGCGGRSPRRCSTTRCPCCSATPTATRWRSRGRRASRSSTTSSSTGASASPTRAFIRDGWQKHILARRRRRHPAARDPLACRQGRLRRAARPLAARPAARLGSRAALHRPIVDLDGYDRATLEDLWNRHQGGREPFVGALAVDQPERVVRTDRLGCLAARAHAKRAPAHTRWRPAEPAQYPRPLLVSERQGDAAGRARPSPCPRRRRRADRCTTTRSTQLPPWIVWTASDGCILHTTFLCARWSERLRDVPAPLRVGRRRSTCPEGRAPAGRVRPRRGARRVARSSSARRASSRASARSSGRPSTRRSQSRMRVRTRRLTGYIDESCAPPSCAGRMVPHAERPFDIVYRATKLPYWFGSHGQLKHRIAEAVQRARRQLAL